MKLKIKSPTAAFPATEFSVQALAGILFEHFGLAKNTRFVVAYSGGCDSQVLLHGLALLRKQTNIDVVAAHFDHGLQVQSRLWARQCKHWCSELEVEFVAVRRLVVSERGQSIEANARNARYLWLDEISQSRQVVVSAHHADDQAETFLLHLFQGKELAQLAGVAPARSLVHGSKTVLIRPLLPFSRAQLLDYARLKKLQWIEDPMNRDLRFYRNYIRHRLMPVLAQRSPGIVGALNRAAACCRRIDERDRATLSACYENFCCPKSAGVFCLTMPLNLQHLNLRLLDDNTVLIGLIRYWIHRAGYASPSQGQLATLCQQIVAQRTTQATLNFNGLVVRYYNRHLYLTKLMPLRTSRMPRIYCANPWDMQIIHIPQYGITVKIVGTTSAQTMRHTLPQGEIHLCWRKGGERVRLHNRQHHSSLKKLFQANDVLPWERDCLPFLTINDEIAWVHGIGGLGEYMTTLNNIGLHLQFSLIND